MYSYDRTARAWGSEAARRHYLRTHPKADPSKHTLTDKAKEKHEKARAKDEEDWKAHVKKQEEEGDGNED